MLPGLNVVQTGGVGGLTTVSLRGAEASFTMVVIDGVPVNDITNLTGGAYDFSGLSTDNIERIEIVRGPLSSLYGSEATGGVVHIISRRGEGKLGIAGEVGLGNFGSRRLAVSTSGKYQAFDFSLAASHFNIEEQTAGDTQELGTISGQAGFGLGSNKSLRVNGRLADSFTTGFPENGGGPEHSILDETKKTDATELVLGSSFEHQASPNWLYSLNADYFTRGQSLSTPAILDSLPPTENAQPSIEGDSTFRRMRFGFQSNWVLPGNWSGSAAFRFRRETGESDLILANFVPSTFDMRRSTGAAAGELLYTSGRMTASLGLRFDKSQGFEPEFSPRVGLNVLLSESGLRLKTSFGEGFKLPSFFSLAEPNVGNPDLRPEKSRGFEVGLELDRKRVTGSVMFFHNQFQDLIDFSPTDFRLINRNKVVSRGGELEVRVRPTDTLELSGHTRYLSLENVDSPEPLRDRPKWRGGLGVAWRPTRSTSISLENLWVGPRFDFQLPVPDQNVVESYSTASLTANQDLTQWMEVFFRADNLFDRDYQEFIGFPNPGLYWRVGLRLRSVP
jgi:outer membrane cobalamin receptor